MSMYERTEKRLRKRRNKLEAEIDRLRKVRDGLIGELEKKESDLQRVKTAQQALDEADDVAEDLLDR